MQWNIRPEEYCARAKARARNAIMRGSRKGLTKLECAYYDAFLRYAHTDFYLP